MVFPEGERGAGKVWSKRYTIVDLPRVGAISGFNLIRNLGPDAVCLYGEGDPGVGVVYHHPTDQVVVRDQGSKRMVLVVDTAEALVGYFPETFAPDGMWSANLGFVQMAKDYIRHDMWVIKLVRRFEESINEAYGPDRARLRDIFRPEYPEVAVVRRPSDPTA